MCQGGPFLKSADANSFLNDPSESNVNNEKTWKYGEEVFCNLEGRYLFIVRNYNNVNGAYFE